MIEDCKTNEIPGSMYDNMVPLSILYLSIKHFQFDFWSYFNIFDSKR